MSRLIAGRLLQGAAIVFVVASLTFALLHVAPGDFCDVQNPQRGVPPDVAAACRARYGLDVSMPEQYVRYLLNLLRGDFGYSFSDARPVTEAIRSRIPATLLLAAAALLIDFTLGIAAGAWQGARPRSRSDDVLTVTTLTLYSIPAFWLGLVLRYVFAQELQVLPVSGIRTEYLYPGLSPVTAAWDHATHLLLPAVTLGLVGAAATARYQRAAMLDVIRQDFVRAARAKGLDDRVVLLRHALRNALLPVVTLLGLSLPMLLSGAVLIEAVFEWPGMGKLAVDAFANRDYPLVTGLAIVSAAMVVLGNLLADLLYRGVDPRTRDAR